MCNHAAAIQPQHKRHTENNLACDSMCMRNAPDSAQILASPGPRTCDRLRSSIIHSALRSPDIHITGMSEPSCMRNKIRQTQMTAQTNNQKHREHSHTSTRMQLLAQGKMQLRERNAQLHLDALGCTCTRSRGSPPACKELTCCMNTSGNCAVRQVECKKTNNTHRHTYTQMHTYTHTHIHTYIHAF